MTNVQIADALSDYRRAKKEVQDSKNELLRICVNDLNMDQLEFSRIDVSTFLDGYLVGQGMMQSWRNQSWRNNGKLEIE